MGVYRLLGFIGPGALERASERLVWNLLVNTAGARSRAQGMHRLAADTGGGRTSAADKGFGLLRRYVDNARAREVITANED
jgi:hypothetical protein